MYRHACLKNNSNIVKIFKGFLANGYIDWTSENTVDKHQEMTWHPEPSPTTETSHWISTNIMSLSTLPLFSSKHDFGRLNNCPVLFLFSPSKTLVADSLCLVALDAPTPALADFLWRSPKLLNGFFEASLGQSFLTRWSQTKGGIKKIINWLSICLNIPKFTQVLFYKSVFNILCQPTFCLQYSDLDRLVASVHFAQQLKHPTVEVCGFLPPGCCDTHTFSIIPFTINGFFKMCWPMPVLNIIPATDTKYLFQCGLIKDSSVTPRCLHDYWLKLSEVPVSFKVTDRWI